MESKKINQLATELTPSLSDLTIIGDPSTGISKKITLSQMASLFTGTVEEYPNVAAFPLVGVADTIYIALDTNVLYRWDTTLTSYVELSPNIINSLVFNDANGFDGTISLVGSVATLTITTALTTGSVGFIGASGALLQDNANFFWDDTNNRLGLGTNAPTTAIDVFGSGIIGRLNGTSTNNAFLGFASAGSNKWSIGNVQADHRFRIYNDATTSELVSVLQTGEFGIGIANPTTKLHIDGGSSALIANLDANVSVAKSLSFRSDNSNRINLEVSGTESGSDAGANFFLRAYSDSGALLNTPLTITRATGAATFVSSITDRTKGLTILNFDGGYGRIQFSSNANYFIGGGDYGAELRISSGNSPIQFYTNGTQKLSIASTGEATFSNTLTSIAFVANQANGGQLYFQTAGTNTGLLTNTNVISGTGSTTDLNAFVYGNNSFGIWTNTFRRLTVDGGGNVGIATVNPLQLLYIQGAPIANNVFSGIGIGDANSERIRIGYNTLGITAGLVPPQIIAGVSNLFLATRDIGGADMVFQTGAGVIEKMRISALGALTYNTTDTQGWFAGFSVNSTNFAYIGSTGQFANSGGTSTDFGIRSAYAIAFYTSGGNERIRITSGGNTLIGTTTDSGYKLDVNGTTRLNGSVLVNQIRTTEGSITAAHTIATTAFTLSGAKAAYQIFVQLPAGAGDPNNYTAYAVVLYDGTAARIIANNGGVMVISLSGLNVQIRQDSGGTQTIDWKYLKLQ